MAFSIPATTVCLLLVVNFNIGLSARTPSIVGDISINFAQDIGGKAVLGCKVENLGHGNTVIWRRLFDPIPITIGTTKFTRSKKYRIKHNSITNDWTLHIKKFSREDAGEYACIVTGVRRVSKTVSIVIKNDDNTYIEPIDSIIEADVGESVLIPCKVVNLKKNKVLWLNEKGEVLAFRKRVYGGDHRIRLIHTTREEWSLRIARLIEEDFGSYTCLVNNDPVVTRTATLKRKGPPHMSPLFIREKHLINVKGREGSGVTLICNFEGYPVPKITWSARVGNREAKKHFSTVGSNLELADLKPEDAGNYTCTGTNGIRPLSRGKVRLIVEPLPTTKAPKTTPSEPTGPSSPIVYPEEERIGVRKGHKAFLVCHSVGHPVPNMYWKWKGRELSNNYKYRIQMIVHGQHRRRTELRVGNIGGGDYGDYECFAHNNRGQSRSKVSMFETFD